MSYKLYFGVDVSKLWLDIAYYDGVDVDWKHGHIRVDNDEKGFAQLGRWLDRLGVGKGTCIFCMEYTGLYSQEFRQWLERMKIVYGMVSPRKMHRFEPDLGEDERSLDRIKTDEMDSFRIAIYCKEHSMKIRRKPSHLPSDAYFKLKRLLAERRQYVKQSTLYKQQLHDIGKYDTEASRHRKEAELASLTEKVLQTSKEMETIIREDADIRRNYDLLCSIKGIGLVVAAETIVLTENFTSITNPRRYACYVGIAPGRKESGVSIQGGDHVGRKGFTQAKADLSMAALHAIHYDKGIRAYWLRRKTEGKHSGVVLNAVKFKIVLRMFAVIRRRKPYVEMEEYGKK